MASSSNSTSSLVNSDAAAAAAISSNNSGSQQEQVVVADNFPSKTYWMIEHCDQNDSQTACWSQDGTHFIVKDTATLAAKHLPRHFKHSNWVSFVRQLHIYGFRTLKDKRQQANQKKDRSVVFHHEHFRKGHVDLLVHIQRSKQGQARKNKSAQQQQRMEEEKKEEYDSFHRRFDMMQRDVARLSEKMDIIINLMVSSSPSSVPAGNRKYPPPPAPDGSTTTKRRRQNDDNGIISPGTSRADSPGSERHSVSDLSTTSQSSGASSPQDRPPTTRTRYISNMDVVLEEERQEGSYNNMNIPTPGVAIAAQASQYEFDANNEEFQDFVDMILDKDVDDLQKEQEEEDSLGEPLPYDSTYVDPSFVADPLRSKVTPAATDGVHEMPTSTTSPIAASNDDEESPPALREENEDYDEEEAGRGSGLPTAVEVTDASVYTRSKPSWWTGTRVLLAIIAALVLISFIVWPAVVFSNRGGGDSEEDDEDESDGRPRPPGGKGPNGPNLPGNQTRPRVRPGILVDVDRDGGDAKDKIAEFFKKTKPVDEEEDSEKIGSDLRFSTQDVLNLTIQGQFYQCNEIFA